ETPSLVRVNQFMIYEKRLSRNEFLNLGLEEVILPKTSIYPSRVDVSMYEGFMGPGVGIVGMFTNYRFQIDDEHIYGNMYWPMKRLEISYSTSGDILNPTYTEYDENWGDDENLWTKRQFTKVGDRFNN